MILITVLISTAQAIPIDTHLYQLKLEEVSFVDEHTIRFTLENPSTRGFDFFDLERAVASINNQIYEQAIAHGESSQQEFSGEEQSTVSFVGTLQAHQTITQTWTLSNSADFTCSDFIDLSLYNKDGKKIGHFVDIPKCEITPKKTLGLQKVSDTNAQYSDEERSINWNLKKNADNKVILEKKNGREEAQLFMLDKEVCPDLHNGQCQTVFDSIVYSENQVFVTLKDMKKQTRVTLNTTQDEKTENQNQESETKEKKINQEFNQNEFVQSAQQMSQTQDRVTDQKIQKQNSSFIFRLLTWIDNLL